MNSYCKAVRDLPLENIHRQHHDTEHGYPARDDDDLFRRLILEINQAGLSFDIVLKKKKTIYEAYPTINKVANYKKNDIEKLMQNSGIIRNRLKIEAAIHNANKIKEIQKEHGTFKNWLDAQNFKTKEQAVKIFKKTFKFTGGEIVNEFLMSTRHLSGAHDKECKIGQKLKS